MWGAGRAPPLFLFETVLSASSSWLMSNPTVVLSCCDVTACQPPTPTPTHKHTKHVSLNSTSLVKPVLLSTTENCRQGKSNKIKSTPTQCAQTAVVLRKFTCIARACLNGKTNGHSSEGQNSVKHSVSAVRQLYRPYSCYIIHVRDTTLAYTTFTPCTWIGNNHTLFWPWWMYKV